MENVNDTELYFIRIDSTVPAVFVFIVLKTLFVEKKKAREKKCAILSSSSFHIAYQCVLWRKYYPPNVSIIYTHRSCVSTMRSSLCVSMLSESSKSFEQEGDQSVCCVYLCFELTPITSEMRRTQINYWCSACFFWFEINSVLYFYFCFSFFFFQTKHQTNTHAHA